MELEYTVTVDDGPEKYTYRRDHRIAERELIDLGGGVRVVVEAVEAEATPGRPGHVRAHTHVKIVHQS